MTLSTWEITHRYQRLVRRGIAEPINCPDCHIEYVKKIGPDTEPVFYCLRCRGTLKPGARMLGDMRKIVNQYFSEDE